MSYKTILVCLTNEEAAMRIMPAACSMARRYEAHLTGIHTLAAIVPYPGIALHFEDPRFEAFNEEMRKQSDRVEKIFADHVSGDSFVGEWHALPAHSTRASDQHIKIALRSDLVIVARPDPEHDRFDQAGIQKDLIVESGRPVLVIPPEQGNRTIGAKVLVAWNATRESARALQAGLPFLKQAGKVDVLTVSSERPHAVSSDTEGHLVAAQLARHGVETMVRHVRQSLPSVGEQILHEAKATGCDLIVMGAFGHTRVHDFIFGDATRFMLADTDIPVLFAG